MSNDKQKISLHPYAASNEHRISELFVWLLKSELTEIEWQEMRKRNAAEVDRNICHSHDFCDANTVMERAFKAVTGKELDLQSEGVVALWNNAWNLAAPYIRSTT